ncbi:MAG: HAD family phosphatase [Anaerolineales bacterium]|nr:HAD family phosphatase [Anaerolineales bacterium]
MITTVLFDVGGVLIRTRTQDPRRRLEKRFHLPQGGVEHLVYNSPNGLSAQRGEISADENWRRIQAELNLNDAEVQEFRREFWSEDHVDVHLVNYIRQLHGPYKTGIISNAMDDLLPLLAEKYAIIDAFDVVVGSAYEKVMKPDPAIYHAALHRLGVEAAQAVFIDDSEHNVAGARAVGMAALHFTPGIDVPQALASMGLTV